MDKHKYLDVISAGPLFDPEPGETIGPDSYATHKHRDLSLIKIIRQWGEVLSNGLASPREVGQYLIDLSREAEELEKEVKFGYNI